MNRQKQFRRMKRNWQDKYPIIITTNRGKDNWVEFKVSPVHDLSQSQNFEAMYDFIDKKWRFYNESGKEIKGRFGWAVRRIARLGTNRGVVG